MMFDNSQIVVQTVVGGCVKELSYLFRVDDNYGLDLQMRI